MMPLVAVSDLSKTYVLHEQGGITIPVLRSTGLAAHAGECVAIHGPSGAGKSTLLRCIYGNCIPDCGTIRIRHGGADIDLTGADPRLILDVRRRTMGYVSQFLRAIPRVSALDVVAEPLRALGVTLESARERAALLLTRLRIPERLWLVAPATFSGGEQQRVNIARGFAAGYPILLLDEPTASLDDDNRAVVISLIAEAKTRGTTVVGVFHDDRVRTTVADRILELKGLAFR
jgi:alpha-D-ribose 1-methylphosphonate 5-triphosphate synthase subunit PhnL